MKDLGKDGEMSSEGIFSNLGTPMNSEGLQWTLTNFNEIDFKFKINFLKNDLSVFIIY